MSATKPTKTIRKRQSCACEGCRNSKKKCDGQLPCARCKKAGKICIYPERRTNKKKELAQLTPGSMHEISVTRKYFELFFDGINPIRMFSTNLDIGNFERPISKPILLQYNAILASAIRSFSNTPQAYQIFENRARQLAGELMDDFSFETALGFELLTFHYWGEDETKSTHFREITLSICKRILQKTNDPKVKAQILRLIVAATGTRGINKQLQELLGIANNLTRLRLEDNSSPMYYSNQIDQQSYYSCNPFHVNLIQNNENNVNKLDDTCFNDDELLTWINFRTKMADLIFPPDDDVNSINPFNENVDKVKVLELLKQADLVGSFMDRHFTSTKNKICHNIIRLLIHTFLFYASGDKMTALYSLSNVVGVIQTHNYVLTILGPFIISFMHIAFRIAFLENDFNLALQITKFQKQLASTMPSGRPLLEENENLLKNSPFFIEEEENSNSLVSDLSNTEANEVSINSFNSIFGTTSSFSFPVLPQSSNLFSPCDFKSFSTADVHSNSSPDMPRNGNMIPPPSSPPGMLGQHSDFFNSSSKVQKVDNEVSNILDLDMESLLDLLPTKT